MTPASETPAAFPASAEDSLICLTMDQDWLPERLLAPVLREVAERGLKLTLFATQALAGDYGPDLELALHPNLMPDSSQGDGEEMILDNLLRWLPGARGVRTHRTFWYADLVNSFLARGLVYDSSLAMPLHPHLRPVLDRGLVRLPIWWTENTHFANRLPGAIYRAPQFAEPGLKVFLVHPIHLLLNTPDMAAYRAAAPRLHPIAGLEMDLVKKLASPSFGMGDLWRDFLDFLAGSGQKTHLMGEVADGALAALNRAGEH